VVLVSKGIEPSEEVSIFKHSAANDLAGEPGKWAQKKKIRQKELVQGPLDKKNAARRWCINEKQRSEKKGPQGVFNAKRGKGKSDSGEWKVRGRGGKDKGGGGPLRKWVGRKEKEISYFKVALVAVSSLEWHPYKKGGCVGETIRFAN